jgi:tetratricopeptide (TPR) repeat protein
MRLLSLFLLLLSCSSFAQHAAFKVGKDSLLLLEMLRKGENLYYVSPDSAKIIWEKALAINRKHIIKNINKYNQSERFILNNRAELIYNIGSYYHNISDISSATRNYLEAQTIYEAIKERLGLSGVYNNLGLIYQVYYKSYDRALKYYLNADSLIASLEDSRFRSVFQSNIGRIYMLQGNYKVAKEYYIKALEIARTSGDTLSLTITLIQFADFELETGDIQFSKRYLMEAIRILSEKKDNKRSLSKCLSLLGMIFLKQGEVEKAEKAGKESLEIAKELKFPANILWSSKLLYQVYEAKGKWKQHIDMLELYDQMKDSLNNEEKKNEVFRQQVKFEYELKKHNDSLAYNLKRQEKELIIEKQELQIQRDRNVRNLILIISGILLVTGWTLNRRLVYRSREAQKKLKIEQLVTEQKLLRAQMNPHFIFNSLNAIQGLILSNQMDAAKKFLVNFSMLMRSVLDYTTRSFITIDEEIALLKSYLEMEQLRFKEKLFFSIHVDPDLESALYRIPPLIIQPFVESAVIRGIQRTDGHGNVKIEILKKGNGIHFQITDNGTEPELSVFRKEEEPSRRISTAIELAGHRLNRINADSGSISNINVEELRDQFDANCGRCVSIFIASGN